MIDKESLGRGIRILPGRKSNEADPKTFRTKPRRLLTEPNETRNQQRGPGNKNNRQSDLRCDEAATETLLAAAAGHGAAAVLQAIHQIGTRTLPGRIETHREPGEQGKTEREEQDRRVQRDSVFERQLTAREFWNYRHNPKREARPDEAGDQTDQHAFENKQPHHATARRAQRHPQRNLTPPTGESNEQ